MLKGLVACIILSATTLPAYAGDRPGAVKAQLSVNLAKSDPAARRDKPAPGRTGARPFMLPAGTARLHPLSPGALRVEQAPVRARGLEPVAWGPGSTLPEVTARAGGRYAVYDVIRAQPRPRHPNSPLSTAFVLRLDGKDDSPAFSIGGGGVAAAVWRAVPR